MSKLPVSARRVLLPLLLLTLAFEVASSIHLHGHGLHRQSFAGEDPAHAFPHWPWPRIDGASYAYSDHLAGADRVVLRGSVARPWAGRERWRLVHRGGVELHVDGESRVAAEAMLPPKASSASVEFDVVWDRDTIPVVLVVRGTARQRCRGTEPAASVERRTRLGRWIPVETARWTPTGRPIDGAGRDALIGAVRSASRSLGAVTAALLLLFAAARLARSHPAAVTVFVLTSLLAVAVRVQVVNECGVGAPGLLNPSIGPDPYAVFARATLAGESAVQGTYFSPGNTHWLALIAHLFGPSLWTALYANAVLTGIGCGALAAAAAVFGGRVAGLLAGTMSALYAPLLFYQSTLQIAPLATFSLACVPLAFLAASRGGPRSRVAAGLLIGLAALVRPTALVLVLPAVALVATGSGIQGWGARLRRSSTLLAGIALAVLPQTALNATSAAPSLISNNGGLNLLLGNHRGSPGRYATSDAFHSAREWMQENESTLLRAVVREVSLDPGRAVELQLAKAGWLVNSNEGGGVLNYELRGLGVSKTLRALSFDGRLGLALLSLLALAGVVHTVRSRASRVELAVFAGAALYAAATVAVMIDGRIRAPLIPLCCLFAARFLSHALRSLRSPGRWLPDAALAALLVAGGSWCAEHLPREDFVPGVPEGAEVVEAPITAGVELVAFLDAGSSTGPRRSFRCALFWRRNGELANDGEEPEVLLRLVSKGEGRVIARRKLRVGAVAFPATPASEWPEGRILREEIFQRVPPSESGPVELQLVLAGSDGGPPRRIELGFLGAHGHNDPE